MSNRQLLSSSLKSDSRIHRDGSSNLGSTANRGGKPQLKIPSFSGKYQKCFSLDQTGGELGVDDDDVSVYTQVSVVAVSRSSTAPNELSSPEPTPEPTHKPSHKSTLESSLSCSSSNTGSVDSSEFDPNDN